MPDKRAVCSKIDSIVIDVLPKKMREAIDENIRVSEDIKVAIKGINTEAVVVTDEGVYIIKDKTECNYHPYNLIESAKTSRKFRRGRFELFVEGLEEEEASGTEGMEFGPDPAKNVVNFPWSKVPQFKKAVKAIQTQKELYKTKAGTLKCDDVDAGEDYKCELQEEIKRLNERLAQLEGNA